MIDRKFILNSVIAALIVAAVLWGVSFVPAIWEPIRCSLSAIGGWLVADISLPTWAFLLLLAVAVPTLLRIVKRNSAAPDSVEPTWRNYVEDTFEGMRWRWRYTLQNSISDLTAFCPEDDTVLIHYYDSLLEQVDYACETCERKFGPIQGDDRFARSKIERQIDRKVRTGEWRQVIGAA